MQLRTCVAPPAARDFYMIAFPQAAKFELAFRYRLVRADGLPELNIRPECQEYKIEKAAPADSLSVLKECDYR